MMTMSRRISKATSAFITGSASGPHLQQEVNSSGQLCQKNRHASDATTRMMRSKTVDAVITGQCQFFPRDSPLQIGIALA